MDENKTYSAEDLLQYAHGQMPAAERHALEKAALEDPFLAEALDGYLENTNNNQQTTSIPHLEELRKIIAEKATDKIVKKQAPVVFMTIDKWLQRALAAIIIIGGAWWLYSISNRPKENATVAKTEQIQPPVAKDSAVIPSLPKQAPTIVLADNSTAKQVQTKANQIKAAPGPVKADEVLADKTAPVEAPTKTANTSTDTALKDIALNEKAFSSDENKYFKKESSKTVVVGYGTQRKAEKELQSASVVSRRLPFVFQGRVLDANNNPLPFSSVMVPGENFGTYSDGQGYFNFVYTDSVLPVHAKSMGFAAQDFNLRSNMKENRIVLNEDKNLDKGMTILRSEKQKVKGSFQPTIVTLDTISSNVEPYVGWNNYGLYLANNNRISDFQLSPSNNTNRSVLLSFEVAEDGGIKNITVDKSQGKDLDAEAIRLLKEGPKWKVKKNGEKGKVEVKF